MSKKPGEVPTLELSTNGSTLAFHKQWNVTHWETLKRQAEGAIRKELWEEFDGKIIIQKAIPRVQKAVSALLVFAQENWFGWKDVYVSLVANNSHK